MKRQILVSTLSLLALLSSCLGEDLPIPTDLSAQEMADRIWDYEIEGFSLSSEMRLSDFLEMHPEDTWNDSQYSERTYCDIKTGECFTKGLTVQLLKGEKDFLFLFEGNQPQSKLVGFALDAKPVRSFVDEYKKILLLLGNPIEVSTAKVSSENTTTVFRTWAVHVAGEEFRFNLFWSPWDDIVTWGLSREPINSEQDGTDPAVPALESKTEDKEEPKPESKPRPQ